LNAREHLCKWVIGAFTNEGCRLNIKNSTVFILRPQEIGNFIEGLVSKQLTPEEINEIIKYSIQA